MYSIVYLILLISILTLEANRTKVSKVDTLTLFSLSFIQSYLMPAFLWTLFPAEYEKKTNYQLYYNAAERSDVLTLIVISYILFVSFYYVLKKIKFRLLLNVTPSGLQRTLNEKKIVFICVIFPIIVLINIYTLGGVNEYITAGNEARHFKKSIGIAGYLNYFLSGTSFAILALLYLNRATKKQIITFITYISIIILSIGLLARGGRGAIVSLLIYIILFKYYLGELKVNIKNIILIVAFLLISLFIVHYLRGISANFLSGNKIFSGIDIPGFFSNIYTIALKPFQYFTHYLFTISEFFQDPSIFNYPRLGSDILSGLLLIIPGSSGEHYGLATLPDVVNQEVMGKTNGYIPPGWIGWSLIDGGIPYLTIKLFISALICSFIDKSYINLSKTTSGVLIYFIFIIFITDLLFIGTAMNLFRGSLGKFLFIFLFVFMPYTRIGKISLSRSK